MLLQTNSYIVPKEKRAEHSRLIRRFRQTLLRLGCDHFEVYEQVGANWSNSESAGRYVQILRFLDRKHQLAVQAAERTDPTAQAVIADFCDLINFPYQQQQGLFAVGFYTSVLPVAPKRGARGELVSTVEHEVIDDPEAEKPYPGASDGPPLDESVEPMPEGIERPTEQPAEPNHSQPQEFLDAQTPEAAIEPAAAAREPLEAVDGHAVEPVADSEPIHAPTEVAESSDDDFMSLVGGDLQSHADVAEDEEANGFIDADAVESDSEVEPAQHHTKDRPPGW
jgi:hypothetical protein